MAYDYVGWGSGPWSRSTWGSSASQVALVGVSAIGYVGAVTVTFRITAAVTGVSATGYVGTVIARLTWAPIDDTQLPNWQNVNTTLANAWAPIGTVQVPNWQ